MRINEFRHGVNVGARIEQTRVGYNLKKQGREKLTDYIAELYEEVITMAANGARGVGAEIQQLPWTGPATRTPSARRTLPTTSWATATATAVKATSPPAMKLNLAAINALR
jgi:hypothetical protein